MFLATGHDNESESSSSSQWPQPCHDFEFAEIQLATANFDESLVIGHGGFGKVYKGAILNRSSPVVAAIKRLDSMSNQGATQFWAEVEILSKLRHCHLVSLIGYCNDQKEMILIYEYISRGSLEDHLHKLRTPLSWLERLKICIGAARGLDYLHTGTGNKHRIIHRDVKSSNILLHESWVAKISDFGLSKIGPKDQPTTYVKTDVKGTFGYIDPNYFRTGKLTRKFDVYAFGVVLFEVLCRKRAVDGSPDHEEWGLARWAQESIKQANLRSIIDSDIRDQISPKCLKDFARIAHPCLHDDPEQRPTMTEVVFNLEAVLALQEKTNNSLQNARKTIFDRAYDMFPFLSKGEHSAHGDSKLSSNEKGNNTRKSSPGMPLGEGGSGKVVLDQISGNTLAPSIPGVRAAVAVKKHKQESFQGHAEWLGSAGDEFFTEYGERSRYKIDKVIGKGSCGVVCSAYDTHLGEKVAIKKIANIFEHNSVAIHTLREIKLLRLLCHPDIVEIKNILLPPSGREFKDIYVVFELMDSDLHEVIKANDDLTPEHHEFFLYQILRGLKYIHTANVFHRDLKPKNILASADCKLKICDFGLARVAFNDTTTSTFWTDYVATRWYRAPELCGSFFSKYTPAIDTWSIGCIFAEILTGKALFPGKNVVCQLDLMTDLLGTPSPGIISRIRNEKARRYLSSMRKKKPIPFSIKFPNEDPLALRLLERMLAFDPCDRPTAEEALSDPYFKNLAKVEREPSCQPITNMEFEFERRRITKEDLRKLIYREILEYHPNMLKELLDGADPTHFMYPSAADRFKQHFTHLVEHYDKGTTAATLESQRSSSLPRTRILYPKEAAQGAVQVTNSSK